jgi:hypothetical protein
MIEFVIENIWMFKNSFENDLSLIVQSYFLVFIQIQLNNLIEMLSDGPSVMAL